MAITSLLLIRIYYEQRQWVEEALQRAAEMSRERPPQQA